MPRISFYHSYVGSLSIDNGIDDAQWGYGLNSKSYPTYGGEVVQILSVYIDDLTLTGTCATYEQIANIYRYFAKYLIAATQGHNKTPTPDESYNLDPVVFSYPSRNWKFDIYPMSTPGFNYQTGMAGPQWSLTSHVIDDSPDLSLIKEGIRGAVTKNINADMGDSSFVQSEGTFNLTGNLSPKYGNPETDPFQTDNPFAMSEQTQASQWADFYTSLIPQYMKGDFGSLMGAVGSQPNFGVRGQPGHYTKGHNNTQTKKAPAQSKRRKRK